LLLSGLLAVVFMAATGYPPGPVSKRERLGFPCEFIGAD
jgi:hypothetical protein